MTTTFDALQRLLMEHKDKLPNDDYEILKHVIDAIHDAQHAEKSHRLDSIIEKSIDGTPWEKRFEQLRRM